MKSNTTATEPEYFVTQARKLDAFSLTPRFSGVGALVGLRNRFNGFAFCVETAETVSGLCTMANTSLKRGVNGRSAGAKYPSKTARGIRRLEAFLSAPAGRSLRQANQQTKTNNKK